MSSLDIVHAEFNITVQDAMNDLELFIDDRNNAELLQSCLEKIKQIDGTLRLIQLDGAALLAQEMIRLANDIPVGADGSKDTALGILSESLLILSRYVEYVVQYRSSLPPLLIPYVNNIRIELKESPLTESHFFSTKLERHASLLDGIPELPTEPPAKLVGRLRHMYQVGLLNLIHNRPQARSLDLMQRAMDRLAKISGNRELGTLWCLAEAVLGCMAKQKMETNRSRKLLFAAIDRQIKQVIKNGWVALETEPPKCLIKDLLYLLGVSGDDSEKIQHLRDAFEMPQISFTDAMLVKQRQTLAGPNANTVASVANILREELQQAKEVLDITSRSDTPEPQGLTELANILTKVGDILLVVGLSGPSKTLKHQVVNILEWAKAEIIPDNQAFIQVADALLFVESTVAGLERLKINDEKLDEISDLAKHKIIASHQLAEAEMLVIREAQAGMAVVKRALNSFAESRFDKALIANVNSSLNSVRGGLVVLDLIRAAKVCQRCIDFVEKSLLRNDDIGAIQHMLETFADAIISLEYYLDEITHNKAAEDKVLEIAEESLDALGFSTAA